MRKHSLRLSVLLLTLLLVTVLALGLAACDPTPQTPDEPTPEEHTTHTPDSTTEWHSDETEHWHLCQEGGEPLSKAAHTFELTVDGEQKTLACSVCGKTVDASAATLKSNDTEHWYEIEKDGETIKTAPVAHDLALLVEGEQKSLKCSVCEKTLDASDATMNKNAEGHWYEIEKDGKTYKTASTSHSKSATAVDKGEQHAFSCTVCQFEYAPEDHTPGDGAHKVDENNHAFTCTACGKDVEEAHKFEKLVNDGTEGHHSECIVCDAETEKTQHKADNELHTEAGNANHWNLCECGEKMNVTAHSYDLTSQGEEGHTGECECGATSALAGHTIKYAQEEGGKHHAYCADCDYVAASVDCATEEGEYEATDDDHTFTCDLCEQSVTKAHTATRYRDSEDGTKHYQSCEVCGHQFNEAEHNVEGAPYVIDEDDDQYHYQTCTICNLKVESTRVKHTLQYTPTEDGSQHTGACEQCDYTSAAEDHVDTEAAQWISWEQHGYICSLCEHVTAKDHDCALTEAYCETCNETRYPGMSAKSTTTVGGVTGLAIVFGHDIDLTKYEKVILPATYKGEDLTIINSYLNDWRRIEDFFRNGMEGDICKTLVIPEGYTTIMKNAFYWTPVENLYIPSTLTTLEDLWANSLAGVADEIEVFPKMYVKSTDQLFKITYDGTHNLFASSLGRMQQYDQEHFTELYTYEDGDLDAVTRVTDLTVPTDITALDLGAFSLVKLDTLRLHKGIVSYKKGGLSDTNREFAFTKIVVEDLDAFVAADGISSPKFMQNTKLYVSGSDQEVTELTISGKIGNRAMYGANITKLTINEGATFTGPAFASTPIKGIYVPSLKVWASAIKGQTANATYSILYTPTKGASVIPLYVDGTELKDLVIDDDTFDAETATKFLFAYSGIESVTFNATNFTAIGEGMFKNSSKLTSVNLGTHVTEIGKNAFLATAIKGDIVVPKQVKSIGAGAFAGLEGHLYFEKGSELTSLAQIGELGSLNKPGDNKYLADSVIIPAGVTTIKTTIFNAPNLKTIFFGGTKETWETLAKTADKNGTAALESITVFYYSESDPGEDQRADKWHYKEDNSTPTFYDADEDGNYLIIIDPIVYYDVNNGGAEWSLLLKADHASEDVTFTFAGENATVSGEGNFMPTKLGVYQVTAKLANHESITKTITVVVYSSALQLGGTVNGKEVTENGTALIAVEEEEMTYTVTAPLKANDKPALLVNHAGTMESYPITEDIFDKEGSKGYEAFATLGEEGLTINTDGYYKFFVTFTKEGYKVKIAASGREIQVHIWGNEGQKDKGSLKFVTFELTEETTYTVTIEITGAEINAWYGGTYAHFQLVLIDGETTKYYNHDDAPNTVQYTKSGYITYSSGWEGNLYWNSQTKPSSTAKATFTVTCEKVGDDVQITKCSITAK